MSDRAAREVMSSSCPHSEEWRNAMSVADDERHGHGCPEELAAIVLRAGRLGFSRCRVATALGISASDLARIEDDPGLTSGTTAPPSPARQSS